MPVYDDSESPKRALVNLQDGNGEFEPSAIYRNDQDGNGEVLVYTAGTGKMIASFEGSEFDDAWGGRKDTVNGDLVVTTERAVDGDAALRHPADGSFDATRSMPGDGLPIYLGVPSKQRFYVWFDDWTVANAYWSFCFRNSGNDRLYLRFWGTDDALFFNETVSGSTNTIARDNAPALPSGEWLEVTIRVNDDQGHFTDLLDFEPHVEVWSVDSSFARTTKQSEFQGDDGAGDATGISTSNALNEGEGGYRWEFQGSAIVDADYHHIP